MIIYKYQKSVIAVLMAFAFINGESVKACCCSHLDAIDPKEKRPLLRESPPNFVNLSSKLNKKKEEENLLCDGIAKDASTIVVERILPAHKNEGLRIFNALYNIFTK